VIAWLQGPLPKFKIVTDKFMQVSIFSIIYFFDLMGVQPYRFLWGNSPECLYKVSAERGGSPMSLVPSHVLVLRC
jgi:hypothetical protein